MRPCVLSAGRISLLAVPLVLLACSSPEASTADYRVWAADQNGNRMYVLDPEGETLSELDLTAKLGSDRPHTHHLSPDSAVLFVAHTISNQASMHRSTDGALLAVVEDVGKAPHAVQPHPLDPGRAYVSNIAPRGTDDDGEPDRGETITELVRGEDGDWTIGRRLDLTAEPLLADTARFPSRRPVLVGFSRDGSEMLVTLFDGGVASVDLEAWRVSRSWGNDRVRRHATLALPSPDGSELYVTGGSDAESWLYVFDVSEEPRLVASHDLSEWGLDAHGAAVDRERRELWIVHRASGTLTVHPLETLHTDPAPVSVLEVAGETPDLIEISPDGRRAYVSLRGPEPAPTIPFPLKGETPGVAVLDVPGRTLLGVRALGDPEEGDFHGIAVVPVPASG